MPLTNEEAHEQAVLVVSQLRQLLSSISTDADPIKALEFMRIVLVEPDKAALMLEKSILETESTLEEARQATTELAQLARSPRKLLDKVKAELPHGEKGRPKRGGPDSALSEKAHWMIPFCVALMRLNAISLKTTTLEKLRFLAGDFPEQSKWTLQHLEELDDLLRDRELLKARTQDGRARNLAYVLAGMHFDLNRHYALRSVRSAIRRIRGS